MATISPVAFTIMPHRLRSPTADSTLVIEYIFAHMIIWATHMIILAAWNNTLLILFISSPFLRFAPDKMIIAHMLIFVNVAA